MAVATMYDYLNVLAADVDQTLDIRPHKILYEDGDANQVVHMGDDNSEERISFSDDSIFVVAMQWTYLSPADSGTIFDLYHDTAKANKMENSFKWEHPLDGHIYVVRFASSLRRFLERPIKHGFKEIRLKFLGYISCELD